MRRQSKRTWRFDARTPLAILSALFVAGAYGASLAACGASHPPSETAPSAVAPRRPELPVIAWPARHEAVRTLPTPPPEPPPELADGASPRYGAEWTHVSARVHVRDREARGLGYLEIVFGEDIDAELPLVMVIHGRGDRPRIPGGPFETLRGDVRIIVPRGPMILGEGFGWLPVRVLDGQVELLAAGLRDVSARLRSLLDQVRGERATRGPTIVTGFSQGGMLAITLAVRHPESLGIALSLAGWLPPPLEPGAAPAGAPIIRAIHGSADERIPYAPSAEAIDHLRALGWDAELATFEGERHAMSPAMDELFGSWLQHALDAIWAGEADLAVRAPPVLEAPVEEPTARRPRGRRPRTARPPRSRPPRSRR